MDEVFLLHKGHFNGGTPKRARTYYFSYTTSDGNTFLHFFTQSKTQTQLSSQAF
jgi:hypothetical protein